jgi:hypothetical protein
VNLTFHSFIPWNADRASELPKLVEDLLQTSISTGPRGAFRLAQGIQVVLGVGGEWLNDFSKVPVLSSLVNLDLLSLGMIEYAKSLSFLRKKICKSLVAPHKRKNEKIKHVCCNSNMIIQLSQEGHPPMPLTPAPHVCEFNVQIVVHPARLIIELPR